MSLRTSIKKLLPVTAFRKIEPIGHLVEAIATTTVHGFPGKSMRIIGVTGTNGKTTTSFMIHKMMVEAGYKVGLITTVAYGIGNDITPQIAHMTTPSSPIIQKRLKAFSKAGVEWVVLETTSHALAQNRTWGVPFEIAVMTNVTHEHLDYHLTFERYLDAKAKLFRIAAKQPAGFGIINADDPNAQLFVAASRESITYGITAGELRAAELQLESDGSRYAATIGDETYTIHCHIPGEFNVYNSLAAISVGRRLGLTKEQIEHGIDALSGVEGRMTVIDEGQPFSVIIDFAHTPDSFERLLGDLRASTTGKLIVLFGSAGRRDESKRAIQGEIAGKYADEVILTEEDDRDIDGMLILDQIAQGAEKSGKIRETDMFLILDRPTAIAKAMSRAISPQDTVILLGKGHEKTIERANGEEPWDEAGQARAAISALRQ